MKFRFVLWELANICQVIDQSVFSYDKRICHGQAPRVAVVPAIMLAPLIFGFPHSPVARIIYNYYERLRESNEYKLFQLLLRDLPKDIFKKKGDIVKSHKRIYIDEMNRNETINLVVNYDDYMNNRLKVIYIFTKYGL